MQERYFISKLLGEGTYGKVKLAIKKSSGEKVAIKTITKSKVANKEDLQRIRREIEILASLRHKHIIQIYEVYESKDKIIIVMEYAEGGELFDHISSCGKLTEKESRKLFRQIISAVHHLHQNGITHRDLKLENILLDAQGNVKLVDFGLSNYWTPNTLLDTFCGSPLYASPEIVSGQPYYGPEVDCWSLGVLLFTLVYGAMPFDGSDLIKLRTQIVTGDYYEPRQKSDASSLIAQLLTVDPVARADVIDAASHWWTNKDSSDLLPYLDSTYLCNSINQLSLDSPTSPDFDPCKKPKKGILKKSCSVNRSCSSDSGCDMTERRSSIDSIDFPLVERKVSVSSDYSSDS